MSEYRGKHFARTVTTWPERARYSPEGVIYDPLADPGSPLFFEPFRILAHAHKCNPTVPLEDLAQEMADKAWQWTQAKRGET